MTLGEPDVSALASRLETLAERLADVEVQVRALMTSQIVEAKEFVVQDERGEIRARPEVQDNSPRLILYDRLGRERLRIGLHPDGSPSVRLQDREISFDGIR